MSPTIALLVLLAAPSNDPQRSDPTPASPTTAAPPPASTRRLSQTWTPVDVAHPRSRSKATGVLQGLAIARGAITSALVISGFTLRIDEKHAQARADLEPCDFLCDMMPSPDLGSMLAYVGGLHSHAVTLGLAGAAGASSGRDDRVGGLVLDPVRVRRRTTTGVSLLVTGIALNAFSPLVMETACDAPSSEDELAAYRGCLRIAAAGAGTMAIGGNAVAAAGAAILGHARHAAPRTAVGVGASKTGASVSVSLRF